MERLGKTMIMVVRIVDIVSWVRTRYLQNTNIVC